jgi:hypothetical protein
MQSFLSLELSLFQTHRLLHRSDAGDELTDHERTGNKSVHTLGNAGNINEDDYD